MSQPSENGRDVLVDFQASSATITQKSDPAYGLRLAQKIASTLGGNATSSYYFERNQRYRRNRAWATGRIDMTQFMDLMQFDGKTNYINLDWSCIHLVNRIISCVVARWMDRNEKIEVTATDALSASEKRDQFKELTYYLENLEHLKQVQASSGAQLIPPGMPADQEELTLWQSYLQRLPEEILYEKGINDILDANGWSDTLKEKVLWDLACTGFVGCYKWMDAEGKIYVEDVSPENAIYSYSNYADFRDTTYRGRLRSMKISEVRRRYGAAFGGKLTEEDIFNIAARSKDYQLTDKITWTAAYETAFFRPYDEHNVDIIEFELKTVDTDTYTVTNTRKNGATIVEPGGPKTRSGKPKAAPADNQTVLSDEYWNIYRGVYVKDSETMLEWGLKKNMIRAGDPRELGNCEFSYSFYMPQAWEMRNLAIPEKIEEPVKNMILTRLRIQQLLAKMKPAGAAINVDAVQELDLGLSTGALSADQVQRHYEQTGNYYFRGRDAEGNPIPVPITELPNAGFAPQLKALIETYQFHYQVVKDELGEDPNLMSAAAQPRVAAANVEVSMREGQNATDYFYAGYLNCMEQAGRKISCLLRDSVTFGASVYRDLIAKEQLVNRSFSTRMRMLPQDSELQVFDALLTQALQETPNLTMFLDPMRLRRVAREDVKLAELLFRSAQKKLMAFTQQQTEQNAQLNAQAQQQSLQMKAQLDFKHMQAEQQLQFQTQEMISRRRNEEIILQGAFNVMAHGSDVAPEWRPVITELINNICLPLLQQNVRQAGQMAPQLQALMGGGGQQTPDNQGQAPDQNNPQAPAQAPPAA